MLIKKYLKLLGFITITSFILLILFKNIKYNKNNKHYLYINTINSRCEKYNRSNDNSNNILFVETNYSRKYLTFKELCAIESAAKHNPELNVYLFSVKAKIKYDKLYLNMYPNIKFKLINLNDLFNGSYLHDWWFSGVLATDPYYRASHLSDALRFTLTYEYGGFYSDLDTIVIKNLSPLRKYNGVGVFNKNINLGSGFMHFKKNDDFMFYILKRFTKNYKPTVWAANGPLMIQNALFDYCNIRSIKELILNDDDLIDVVGVNKTRKLEFCSVSLYPHKYLYPFHWKESKELFEHNSIINIAKLIDAYQIHFYGFVTKENEVEINENSIYEFYAKLNCPFAYSQFSLNVS